MRPPASSNQVKCLPKEIFMLEESHPVSLWLFWAPICVGSSVRRRRLCKHPFTLFWVRDRAWETSSFLCCSCCRGFHPRFVLQGRTKKTPRLSCEPSRPLAHGKTRECSSTNFHPFPASDIALEPVRGVCPPLKKLECPGRSKSCADGRSERAPLSGHRPGEREIYNFVSGMEGEAIKSGEGAGIPTDKRRACQWRAPPMAPRPFPDGCKVDDRNV